MISNLNVITILNDSYTDEQLSDVKLFLAQDIIGDELQYNTLEATLETSKVEATEFITSEGQDFYTKDNAQLMVLPFVSSATGNPENYTYGAETIVYHKGKLLGRFYLSDIAKISPNKYRIKCISGIGLLANSQHYGGVYDNVNNRRNFKQLVDELFGDIVPHGVSPELAKIPVYGWLPVGTRRDNLHHLLVATGAIVKLDENGNPYIAPPSNETKTEITDDRFFIGGKVKNPETGTVVSVIEHTFTQTSLDKKEVLFSGDIPDEQIVTPKGTVTRGGIVLFEAPAHAPFAVNKGSIIETGDNYAVLAPSVSCELTGLLYTHTMREVTRTKPTARGLEQEKNHVSVKDETLISFANVENVAQRLLTYFGEAKIVSSDVEIREEKPGEAIQFNSPFKVKTDGFLSSMDINLSNKLKAGCKIVADYDPPNPGNTYNNVEVISTNRNWTVPAKVNKIRLVVIGGGSGGQSGGKGKASPGGVTQVYEGGAGGIKGSGGPGGKIFITSVDVTPGQVFTATIGKGGSGGVCTSETPSNGALGSETRFSNYSSNLGTASVTGYTELVNGVTYGIPGSEGVSNGGKGASVYDNGETLNILGVTYRPGATGASASDEGSDWSATADGGYGGGPAYGRNGLAGEDGEVKYNAGYGFAQGGSGGEGATCTIPGLSGVNFGSGGQGGSGGGGGGGGGRARHSDSSYQSVGNGGPGGKGSNGGRGADGCVIIYY